MLKFKGAHLLVDNISKLHTNETSWIITQQILYKSVVSKLHQLLVHILIRVEQLLDLPMRGHKDLEDIKILFSTIIKSWKQVVSRNTYLISCSKKSGIILKSFFNQFTKSIK